MSDSTSGLMDCLVEITPIQIRGRRPDARRIEFDFDGINWEDVPSRLLVDEEEIITTGFHSGGFEEIDTSDFEGIHSEFDNALTDANEVFVSENRIFVTQFAADNVRQDDLSAEALTVLSELSRKGMISGLRPLEDILPPDFNEIVEFNEAIQDFQLEDDNEELICRVIPAKEVSERDILEDIRTQNGITYPKPDRIETISKLD